MSDIPVKREQQQKPASRDQDARRRTYVPAVDILDGADAVEVIADMPGIDEKNTEVDLERNVLTLRGTFELEPPEGFNLMYQEYRSGDYERSFTLGSEIDRDGIEATARNGTVHIRLPKAKEAQPRKIPVSTG